MEPNSINAMQLEVGNYYIHKKSKTMWHVLSTMASVPPTFTVEVKNIYGDTEVVNQITDRVGLYAKEDSFEEITKKQWDERGQ